MGKGDFDCPSRLVELCAACPVEHPKGGRRAVPLARKPMTPVLFTLGRCAADPAAAATPVCVLYSTDTVGGNSGSPVLDADGNFVAINFDRQRLGLMNEFKWSREYSRSIGTDVRYLLLLITLTLTLTPNP